jgi:hypothetical protein
MHSIAWLVEVTSLEKWLPNRHRRVTIVLLRRGIVEKESGSRRKEKEGGKATCHLTEKKHVFC